MKTCQKIVIAVSLLGMVLSCRNDPAPSKPKIEKITFEETTKNIYIGDTVKINVNAEPKNAKESNKIEYSVTESGIIEIKEDSGNDGVVFEGIKRGATVITAKANGVVDYCSVNVLGGNENVIPHIIVPYYVMECRENERRSIVASLAGGTPLDDSGFIWSYSNQKVISLESTGNVGVFDTLNIGDSVVTISHPKAQFSVDVLIYVIGNDEIPVYITTDNNVVNLKTTDSNYQYAVELRGGDSSDYYNFTHELLDGGEIIELRVNNNIGTINPKAKGIARIGISHPKAAYRLEIVIIVNEEVEYRYIDVDKTLIIMEEGYSEVLNAELIGDTPLNHIDKYIFENENDNVIMVEQSHNQFRIIALQRGRSVLKIKNEYADFDREVLVIVNGIGSIQDNEVYITTNQNVITTEAGGDDVLLTMTLVGGNEADRNNFVWTVDDGSIISVESAHGRVEYKNRSAVSNIGEKFEAQAVIKAKKVGTAMITLENPKAKNDFSVIVKVYKKGVFGVIPVVVDGPSVYKVGIGEQLPAYLKVVTGSEQNFTNVTWTSGNSGIVSVSGTGLTGMLEGKGAGITTVTVSGDNVKHDYSATVIVGSDEYLRTMPFMYVLNPFMSVIKGESVSFRIMCEKMSREEIAGINVINNNGDIMEVFAYKDSVTVTGVALGEGEIVICSSGLNTVRVVVMVEDYDLNPDMPYYLRTDKYIYGMAKGHNLEIGVDLVGGSAVNERNIVWKIEDTNVAMISGNGKQCLITGRNAGQTVITVSHPKSHNELEIVIYVVENESELNSKVVTYVKERNMLLNIGETRYISIITNASDAQKNSFQWDISNYNVIDVSVSGDRIKAYVAAKSAGNAVITVRSGNQTVPVVIYVSVISKMYSGAYINVPSIVEMTAGETLSINAVTNNIKDKHNITWSVKDDGIAIVYGNGDTCLVNALNGGDTAITVEYKQEGFVKDIILYVYNSVEEMASRYIIAGEQSRYVINKGDIINVNLVFGMKGYPEHELHNVWWRTGDSTVIEVTGNGKTANVKGLSAGTGKIAIGSNIAHTVEIEVEVREDGGKAGQYWFSVNERDRIKGILAGSYTDIEVRMFIGNNEVFNISGIEYIAEHDDLISVTANGNNIRVVSAAGKEGQSFITVRHDLAEDTRILIYTALSEYGLENAYPILADKTNYLIKKDENVTITIRTKDNDNAKLRNISYGLERNNGVVSVSERNKREIVVNAQNVGSDVILVRYNAQVAQRIYVSVTETHYGSNAGYMVTENIIGLLWDTEYETKVETDVSGGIIWKKQNDYVIDIVTSSDKSAVIKGNILGRTILTVSAGDIERNIAVFVCETEEELRRYQAINIEQRKYRIRKNENVTINIHSYQGKVEGETRYGDYYNYDSPYGNVIEVNAVENNKLSVKGLNEGAAAIRVINEFYKTEIVVHIEVAAADEGNIGIVDRRHYMSAEKTLYVIGKNEQNITISVDVIGNDFYGDAYWIWSDYDGSIISVNDTGRNAVVNPKKEGQTKIRISNKDCANTLDITVIVGERFVVDNSLLPYIYVEKNLYEVTKDAGAISIPYSIVNVNNVNLNNIGYRISGNTISVSHDAVNSVFNITINGTGIARFDITYGDLRRDVYVLVKENMNLGNIYLTTSENYVVASVGELRMVNIQLAGYDEINSNNFSWSVEPKNGVIQLVGNGTTGQLYGVGEGNAVVTVRHPKAEPYPLEINVKVVKDRVKESVIYLTTQRNVIETVEGTAVEQIYVQKIGGDVTKNQTTWMSSDSSIVEIKHQGYTAQFEAKKEGVARIKVTNEETGSYVLEIVVIVRAALNNNIYIDSSSTLLLLSPGEMQQRISVTLVNGDVKDNNKFKWGIDYQQPSDINIAEVSNSKVINIVGSNEECFINAVNEGIARIRVKNEKAERDLIITVYVTHYKEIKFSVSTKEIVVGENEFVGINLPTYEYMGNKVKVSVVQTDGSSGSEICECFYTNELVLLSGKKPGVVIVKAAVEGKEGEAQLYVNVVEKTDPNVNRIIAGKTMHILNPKSNPLLLNASVGGPNVFDVDNDNIQWQLNKTGIIDIMPKNEPLSSAKGRQVQITPKGLGTVTVMVKHSYVDEKYWKEVSIIVAETNNMFSVSRNDITVNSLRPETVSAEIVGGTTKDYAEIKWIARMQQKWDGTMLEVVRVMGSGREVVLYPMNDGETEVLAMYGKEVVSIKVKVVSDYYFSFRNGNEYMYPGQVKDLLFDVRPASSNVHWVNNVDIDKMPIVSYAEVLGSSPGGEKGDVARYLRVNALSEGTTSIIGMANGKISQVNIITQYDYSFNTAKSIEGKPKYYGMVDGQLKNYNGIMYAEYTVYPPDTYIKAMNNIPGLEIEIEPPVKKVTTIGDKGVVGVGRIKYTGNREIKDEVKFKHYKAKPAGSDRGDIPVGGNTDEITVYITYSFGEPITPVPYFIRGEGKYSNTTAVNGTTARSAYTLLNGGGTQGESIQYNGIVGGVPQYSLNLGDGEVHYILFDKKFDTSFLDIQGIINTELDVINGVKFSADSVELNVDGINRKAIRLSSSKDYIEYNRVKFNQELFMYVSSAYDDGSSVIQIKNTDLYENYYFIKYEITANVYSGEWYSMYYNETIEDGSEAPYKEYYLLRNNKMNSITNEIVAGLTTTYKAKYITTEPWLTSYYDNYAYTYYFNGNEINTSFGMLIVNAHARNFKNLLDDYCDKVKVYKPSFNYSWDIYVANIDKFNQSGESVNTRNLIYDNETNKIIGGYVSSYYMLGDIVQESKERDILVYEYDPKGIIELINESDVSKIDWSQYEFNLTQDASGKYTKWDRGFYQDSMAVKIIDYNKDYLYSTIKYTYDMPVVIVVNGSEKATRYNVLRDFYVDNDGIKIERNGVGISVDSPSNYYQDGPKRYNRWEDSDWEHFFYDGLKEMPVYNSVGMALSTKGWNAPLNGVIKKSGKEKYFIRMEEGMEHGTRYEVAVYGERIIPQNIGGRNIFARLNNNEDIRYGEYGDYWRYACDWCYRDGQGDKDTYNLYSKASARQMLKWEAGNTIIAPYYIFNRFPFRYQKSNPRINRNDKNIVKITDGGGKPMPSIDKNRIVYLNKDLGISFQTYDFQSSAGNNSAIRLRITCEVRKNHMMYNGSESSDSYINTGNLVEYEGTINSFSDEHFNKEEQAYIKNFFN